MDDFEDEAGYAKPLTPEFIQKVNDTVCEVASDADIIVTTARIFGDLHRLLFLLQQLRISNLVL